MDGASLRRKEIGDGARCREEPGWGMGGGGTKLESLKVRVGFNRKKSSQEQVGLRTPERLAEPDHSAADSESYL